ncbi:MAG: imidazole glycerol phosphate synthase subunit HisH [Candidatus Omnitrophica bacterium]|nr:imidazole glycerol phosphate synthase subunit HisH [Candidatus Omnitrophota bacterium]MDD5652959.1 imidazole glycerol phosphate synthase subunit HisH [Candidatus Omnitrophota bacterium]
MIAIVDYGMGNLHSVEKALQSFGEKTLIADTAAALKKCEKIVLPGVGAFDDAMAELKKKKIDLAIKEAVKNKKIFLGICLGMQLLFEESEEANSEKGLGLLLGKVNRFSEKSGQKVPQMGWNQLMIEQKNCPLLKGIASGAQVYFCHSFYPAPAENSVIAATTDYGIKFSSIVWKENVYGVQFHPEKSQEIGLKILKNFVELC